MSHRWRHMQTIRERETMLRPEDRPRQDESPSGVSGRPTPSLERIRMCRIVYPSEAIRGRLPSAGPPAAVVAAARMSDVAGVTLLGCAARRTADATGPGITWADI